MAFASLTFKEIKARPVICKLTRPAVARIGAMTASVTSRQAANLAEIARCRRAARAPRPRACDVLRRLNPNWSHFFSPGPEMCVYLKETAKTVKPVKLS